MTGYSHRANNNCPESPFVLYAIKFAVNHTASGYIPWSSKSHLYPLVYDFITVYIWQTLKKEKANFVLFHFYQTSDWSTCLLYISKEYP